MASPAWKDRTILVLDVRTTIVSLHRKRSKDAKGHREKIALYERHAVREYVIVHPEERFLEQLVLGEDGRSGRATIVAVDETYKSAIFPGLEIGLSVVFAA